MLTASRVVLSYLVLIPLSSCYDVCHFENSSFILVADGLLYECLPLFAADNVNFVIMLNLFEFTCNAPNCSHSVRCCRSCLESLIPAAIMSSNLINDVFLCLCKSLKVQFVICQSDCALSTFVSFLIMGGPHASLSSSCIVGGPFNTCLIAVNSFSLLSCLMSSDTVAGGPTTLLVQKKKDEAVEDVKL